MNERILELADKAVEDMPSGPWNIPDEFCKKFAELIVRECMKEAWDEIVSDEDIAAETNPLIREYLIGQNQGIVDAVIRFRNHFGVEE
jgi:hypothetical protein